MKELTVIKPNTKLIADVDHLLKLQREITQLETECYQGIMRYASDRERIGWRREIFDRAMRSFSEKWSCLITDRPIARRPGESCSMADLYSGGQTCS